MNRSLSKWVTGTVAAAALVSVVGCGSTSTNNTASNTANSTTGGSAPTNVSLVETGSSLLYPLFNSQWIQAYQSVDSSVTITASSTGSGKGINDAIAGNADIGASDAYLAPAQVASSPNMLNIPLAISAQQIMYNVPGVSASQHLKLTGSVIADIYMGKIKYWDDAQIASLNSGVKLPHLAIVPVRRSDGSGDTFLFTQFMTDTSSAWKSAGVNYGTTVTWPSLSTEIGAKGNDGVVSTMAQTKGSIGYVGISWLDKATQQGLGYAALQNKSGSFVLPTTANIQAAANAMTSQTPANEAISLIYAPGANSYPIINFEYAIINTQDKNAAALKKFLNWAIDPNGGNSSQYLTPVHFLPLPASVEPLSQAQINKIGG